jgi:hypothetical protein
MHLASHYMSAHGNQASTVPFHAVIFVPARFIYTCDKSLHLHERPRSHEGGCRQSFASQASTDSSTVITIPITRNTTDISFFRFWLTNGGSTHGRRAE